MKIVVWFARHGRLNSICVACLLFVCASIGVLAQAGKDAGPAELIERLQEQDKQVRLAALKETKGLGVKAEAAIQTLALLLKDPAEEVRERAAEALGKLGAAARTTLRL